VHVNVCFECACDKFLFIPLACAECDNSLLFSGASSIPATLLHQLFFHPLSPHLAIYFLVYLSILLFPNSKGNKTVPGKVATTHTEDGHRQNTKTSITI